MRPIRTFLSLAALVSTLSCATASAAVPSPVPATQPPPPSSEQQPPSPPPAASPSDDRDEEPSLTYSHTDFHIGLEHRTLNSGIPAANTSDSAATTAYTLRPDFVFTTHNNYSFSFPLFLQGRTVTRPDQAYSAPALGIAVHYTNTAKNPTHDLLFFYRYTFREELLAQTPDIHTAGTTLRFGDKQQFHLDATVQGNGDGVKAYHARSGFSFKPSKPLSFGVSVHYQQHLLDDRYTHATLSAAWQPCASFFIEGRARAGQVRGFDFHAVLLPVKQLRLEGSITSHSLRGARVNIDDTHALLSAALRF